MTQQDYDKSTSLLVSIGRLRSVRQDHADNPKIAAAFDEQISELEEEFANLGTIKGFHNEVRKLTGSEWSMVKVDIRSDGKETFGAWDGKGWFYGTSQQEVLDEIQQQ